MLGSALASPLGTSMLGRRADGAALAAPEVVPEGLAALLQPATVIAAIAATARIPIL
jgi:hypothetical protein